MYRVVRTGRNRFQLRKGNRRVGTAKSRHDARVIARNMWYTDGVEGSKPHREKVTRQDG